MAPIVIRPLTKDVSLGFVFALSVVALLTASVLLVLGVASLFDAGESGAGDRLSFVQRLF